MSKIKLIMTVCVGVLALSALTLASSASAQWMVNKATLSGTETRALATTAKTDENGLLKAAGVTITCKGETLNGTGPQIEAAGEMGSASSLTFTSCSANENCSVPTSISTVPILVHLELSTAGNLIPVKLLFLPKTKNTFATIKFEGEKCALLGVQPVTGKATVSAPTGGEERTLQEIAANVTEAANELKVGSSAAELKGRALLQLATPAPWSFLLP